MLLRRKSVHGLAAIASGLGLLATAGCHREIEVMPLATQKIYVSDKFFDVAVMDPKRALVIGYGGKIIESTDGGFTWNQIDADTEKALYSIGFAPGGQVGWIVGQEGLILRTEDSGKTWTHQYAELWLDSLCTDPEERKYRLGDVEAVPCQPAYLFAVSVVDENTAHAIGDKSIYTRTTDGGKTWTTRTLKVEEAEAIGEDLELAFEDPVLYDVEFLDADRGYIVGEFGKIYYTEDGGNTFVEQQESLMDDESIVDILDLPTLFDVEFFDDKHGIVAGLDGRVAETRDGGNDWSFVPHNIQEFVDPFYAGTILPDGTRWVVGASGQVLRGDAGAGLVRGDLGSRVNNWIRRIRFHDDKHGWIVGGFGLIMNTDDGGKTWYRRIG
jgi:photosystem II stability/assembly factor-like uncharacterized protein